MGKEKGVWHGIKVSEEFYLSFKGLEGSRGTIIIHKMFRVQTIEG